MRLLLASFALFTGLLPVGLPAEALPREISSPGPVDTGESNLHPGPDGTVYLTYSGPGPQPGERALWLATLAPDATAWSAPQAIVSTPLLMENWADFASLTVATDGALWAQWFQRHPGKDSHGYAGWYARSTDRGATWTKPARLGHEFVSLAPLSQGRVMAVWLESTRERDPERSASRQSLGEGGPRPSQDPAASYHPSMRLKARLLAPDGTTLQDWVVDPDVCTCCQTTLARLPDDRLAVAYRGHTRDEIRDNRIARFGGTTWTPPRSLHDDGWQINACPVNGPAADARGEKLALAWFTAAQGVARVLAKQSLDGGLTFGPPQPIDLGRPIGRIDLVTLADGSSLVSWLESRTEQNAAGLYVRRLFPDGTLSAPLLIAATSAVRASGFARLAIRPGADLAVVISWTDATLTDPANPKSPAVTHVRTAEFPATALPRTTSTTANPPASPVRAVVRANEIAFLELCVPTVSNQNHPAHSP